MGIKIKFALTAALLLATLFGQRTHLFGQELQCQQQGKTFLQYFDELSSEDPKVREEANAALKKMALEANSYQYSTVQQCIKHLKNKNGYVRMRAIEALGEMGPKAKDAIPSLLEAMHNDEQNSEMHVIMTLGKMEPELTAVLPEIINNKKTNIKARRSAVRVLWKHEPHSKQTISLLIKLLKDKGEDTIVREHACIALEVNGSEAEQIIPELIKTFRASGDDTTVRFRAALALGRRFNKAEGCQKEEVIQTFLNVLRKENEKPTARGIAAMILGQVDPGGKRTIPIFMKILRKDEQHEYVLSGTIRGLEAIGPAAKEAVPLLKEMLKHKKEGIRKLSAEALEKIDIKEQKKSLQKQSSDQRDEERPIPPQPEEKTHLKSTKTKHIDIKHYMKQLDVGNSFISQMDTLKTLRNLGPESKQAVPEIMDAILANDIYYQKLLVDIWKAIEPEFMATIPGILRDKNSKIKTRRVAVRVLKFDKTIAKQAISLLKNIFLNKKEDVALRRDACETLGWLSSDSEQVAPLMIKAFTDETEDSVLRSKAGIALGYMKTKAKQIIPSVIRILHKRSEHPDVRVSAVLALGELFPGIFDESQKGDIIQAIMNIVQNENEDQLVRCHAASVLADIDPEGKQTVTVLRKIFRDKKQHECTRIGAAQGLITIDPEFDEAILLLKKMSRHKNEKIRKLAIEILEKTACHDNDKISKLAYEVLEEIEGDDRGFKDKSPNR